MNFGDRPGDWLGYAPGDSPLREKGGPMSPKKKTMNWRVARDMQLSKEQDKSSSDKNPTSIPLKAMPDIEKSPIAAPKQEEEQEEEEDLEQVDVNEESHSSGSEDVVEIVTEEDDEEVEEVVEYDDDDDDVSEYEEEVIEESEGSEEDSMFEPLPPPIEIPNALKPVHLRTPEPAEKPKVVYAKDDSSSSSDDDDDDDHEATGKADTIREAPRVSPRSVRPDAVRGHSCDDDIEAMSNAVRASSSGEKEGNDDLDDGIKVAPRVAPRSIRPAVVRGHSCDDDIKEMSQEVRGGRKPAKKIDAEESEEEDSKPAAAGMEQPRMESPRSLRPETLRGHSFDKDIKTMSDAVQGPRGGKRPSKKEVNEEDPDASASPVNPLRPTTLRGHSCDKDIEKMNNSVRGGKRTDAAKKQDYRSLRDDQPTSPNSSYRSLKDSVPTTPKTPTAASRSSSTKTSVTPKTPTPSYNAPKTPTRAPVTPKTPSRGSRGEDTAPPTPCYTRVDENGVEHKEYTWEKPAWATGNALRSTAKGEKLKQGSDISRPIGGIKPID